MSAKDVLQTLTDRMNQSPEGIAGMQAVYQFDLSGEAGGTYQIKLSDGKAEYMEGAAHEAKCALQLSEDDFTALLQGHLNPTQAFMTGKLKIKGDMGAALKLQTLLGAYQG